MRGRRGGISGPGAIHNGLVAINTKAASLTTSAARVVKRHRGDEELATSARFTQLRALLREDLNNTEHTVQYWRSRYFCSACHSSIRCVGAYPAALQAWLTNKCQPIAREPSRPIDHYPVPGTEPVVIGGVHLHLCREGGDGHPQLVLL